MTDDAGSTGRLARTVGEEHDDGAMLRQVVAGLQMPEKRISSKLATRRPPNVTYRSVDGSRSKRIVLTGSPSGTGVVNPTLSGSVTA